MKRLGKLWVGAFCAIALAVLVLAQIRRRGEILSFQIVDYVTGKPIQGTTVELSRRWTRLPVDSIPLVHVDPFYSRTVRAETGVVRITDVPKLDLSCRIVVGARGYGEAFIQQQPPDECSNPDVYRIVYFGTNWLHVSP